MNRRQFVGALSSGAATIALGGVSLGLSGCNPVTDLENWIPVALTAVSQIVKLLGPVVPAPVAAAILLIQAGFSALLTTLQNYKKGTGVLSDIANAISAVESAFQSFFASLNVPSTLVNTIEGLVAIIVSTIQAFANEINPSPTPVTAVNGKAIPVSPKRRSAKQFTSDWNAQCISSGHPEAEI